MVLREILSTNLISELNNSYFKTSQAIRFLAHLNRCSKESKIMRRNGGEREGDEEGL